jgi:hypothetical protein
VPKPKFQTTRNLVESGPVCRNGFFSRLVLSFALLAMMVIGVVQPAQAGTHTWTPRVHILSTGQVTLDKVVIIGNHIDYGSGNFDFGFTTTSDYAPSDCFISSCGVVFQAQMNAKRIASILYDTCTNPALSAALKNTKSTSDGLDRWLTASAIYNSMVLNNMVQMYTERIRPISIILDGQAYKGFPVKYADGAEETWIIRPNANVSSDKIFDVPAPASTTPATKAGC